MAHAPSYRSAASGAPSEGTGSRSDDSIQTRSRFVPTYRLMGWAKQSPEIKRRGVDLAGGVLEGLEDGEVAVLKPRVLPDEGD